MKRNLLIISSLLAMPFCEATASTQNEQEQAVFSLSSLIESNNAEIEILQNQNIQITSLKETIQSIEATINTILEDLKLGHSVNSSLIKIVVFKPFNFEDQSFFDAPFSEKLEKLKTVMLEKEMTKTQLETLKFQQQQLNLLRDSGISTKRMTASDYVAQNTPTQIISSPSAATPSPEQTPAGSLSSSSTPVTIHQDVPAIQISPVAATSTATPAQATTAAVVATAQPVESIAIPPQQAAATATPAQEATTAATTTQPVEQPRQRTLIEKSRTETVCTGTQSVFSKLKKKTQHNLVAITIKDIFEQNIDGSLSKIEEKFESKRPFNNHGGCLAGFPCGTTPVYLQKYF